MNTSAPATPSGRGVGALGLVLGGLAVGVVTAGVVLLAGDHDGVPDDGPHRLLPPEAAGTSYRTGDAVLPEGAERTVAAFGVENATTVNANYADGEEQFAIFAGAWGRVDDPAHAVDAAFAQLDAAVAQDPDATTELRGEPGRVTPEGAEDAVVTCRLAVGTGLRSEEPQETQFCMWADHSTAGMVVVSRASGRISREEAARFTADLRHSARLPAS
ncbi:hypothetical protein GCM10023347_43440 [Streptomyces chumphonensis]|uniref:Uncharacterized protein n=1 Tax=Streptomyces chumphonensis TaxID=1214925 RepID=A0A927F2T7_9ACTN|nr:hypothetical protein [Streptomyces chumphonensis]MBD3934181.1 hypothetical protein [Streptomyces chumphonensis]